VSNDLPEAAPVAAGERVVLMDVLRGVALFGVFLMNLLPFAGQDVMATETQLLSLPTAGLDFTLRNVLYWLVADKSNTIFAFLFGVGFYLQMSRLDARGAESVAIYRRRLIWLFVIGVFHNFFLWTWDILHLYALAGFFLLTLRRMSNRGLVIGGLLLALLGRTAIKTVLEFSEGSPGGLGFDLYSDQGALMRQALSESGNYLGLVGHFFDMTMVDYVLTGFIVGWLAYALGRFLIGAWVGRHDWITRAADFLPGWLRVRRWTLLAGLIIEGVAVLLTDSSLLPEFEHRELCADALHLLAVPVLATGYVSALVVAFHGERGRRILAPFAYVGRMALTSYITQSFIIGFVLFGVGPGLALAGRIGTCALTGIVVVGFSLQLLFSRWWLGRFHYGPVEWVWRALTYGAMPKLRKWGHS
jgi:uncharacterized protein